MIKFEIITTENLQEWESKALLRNLSIHNSHPFIKGEDKTQIIRPKKIGEEIYKTRQTHSEEVSIIGEIISYNIGFKYPQQVKNVCLLHDIGHPPFGHDGQKILDKVMKKYGLVEGFQDNNANFDVIFNNDIDVSPYEMVSLLKHPEELYESQKKMLGNILKSALEFEKEEWGEKKYTMACMIMDIADEIGYSFSDFVDGYNLGYTNFKIVKFVEEMIKLSTSKEVQNILKEIRKNLLTDKSKRENRRLVNKLKLEIVNSVKYDYDTSSLVMSDNNRIIKKAFSDFNLDHFIHNKKVEIDRGEESVIFETFCEFILSNEYFTSNMYSKKHLKMKGKENQLRNLRNMIGDLTDNYVLDFVRNELS